MKRKSIDSIKQRCKSLRAQHKAKGLLIQLRKKRELWCMEQDYFSILFYTNFSLVLIILFCIVEICIIIKLKELNIFLTQIFRVLVPFRSIKLYGDAVIVFCLMALISEYCVQDIYCQTEFH